MGVREGTISVDGYQILYRCVGSGGIPLLLLHGGPGAGMITWSRSKRERLTA